MKTNPTIAIAGATGLVGNEMIVVLEQLKVPFGEVRLLASEDSVGEVYRVGSHEVSVEVLDENSFSDVDVALFATSAELSRKFVPIAVEHGAIAIDNSSHFRMDPNVPLVVPEVNPGTVSSSTRIIANPNCSTIQLVPVLQSEGAPHRSVPAPDSVQLHSADRRGARQRLHQGRVQDHQREP
jgi:aspartate-semialdehyde dehydrogenase